MKRTAYIVYDAAVEGFAAELATKWEKEGYCSVAGKMSITANEQNKTLATVQELCSWLLEMGADRKATLIAVGGGVTTDICGFVAAIYKRGISVENVPTTLLSQVDAAIGGKTGVNLDGVKNTIGVIRLPAKVHFFSEPLKTLPEAELRSGAAELIKTFALFDAPKYERAIHIFTLLNGAGYSQEAIEAALPEVIELARAAGKYKEKVVKRDLMDKGKRHLLNLGHTYGHAIEWWQNTPDDETGVRYSHGEAVAIGMVQAARASEQERYAKPGLADRLAADLSACGLPVELPCPVENLLPAIGNDKKIESGKVDFVYLRSIGRPVLKKTKLSLLSTFLKKSA